MRYFHYARLPAFALLFTTLIQGGCGGSGSDGTLAGGGIGGTGITSGTVTGFGSVFVNGIEFDTRGSTFNIDNDAAATESDLGIGMVVTVTGSVDEDGLSGMAERIDYDDVVEGPIAAAPVENADRVTKTFTVLDLTIIANSHTTVFVNTDYGTLARDDVVEISGYYGAGGVLLASRIEKVGVLTAGTLVEARGTVSGFNGVDTFGLGTLTVLFDGVTEFEDLPGGVANGQYVEVGGTFTAPASIMATRIEREDEGFGDEVGNVSLEGIASDFSGIGDFRISGQAVTASDATRFEPPGLANILQDGDKIEVRGSIVAGVLQAAEIAQRGGELVIDGKVTGKNQVAGTLVIEVVAGQPLTVYTNPQTLFDDERDATDNCTLAGIMVNDELEIIAYIDSSGVPVASHITCDDLETYELRGPADVPPTGGDSNTGSVTIFGITILTDDRTEFEDESEATLTGLEFFDRIRDGDLVKFEDEVPIDGIADEAEFEY